MIIKFMRGVQVCVGDTWFNLFLHRWRGVWFEHTPILDSNEYTLAIGWITFEVEH